jgi:hypothetical protein
VAGEVVDLTQYRVRQLEPGKVVCECGYEQYALGGDPVDPCECCGSTAVEFIESLR